MRRITEPDAASVSGGRATQSLRVVMTRACDVVWQAGPDGAVSHVRVCRPALSSGEGELDGSEVQRIEQLWRRCVRCAERLSAVYHVGEPGADARTFHITASPVLDTRDEVLYWSGSVAEMHDFADVGSLFVSEAAAVLSSSLNRSTIVNRLVETSVAQFSDLCAIHVFDDAGAMVCEGIADRRLESNVEPQALIEALEEAVRVRQPLLLLSAALRDPIDVKMHHFLRGIGARSMIAVPLFVGNSCIGTLAFLESERSPSFTSRDVDAAVVVGRQLVLALENIKTFEREQRVTERFRFMARVTEQLFTTLEAKKLLELVLAELGTGLADYGVAVELHEERLRVLASLATTAPLRDDVEEIIVESLQQRRSILAGAVASLERDAQLRAGPLFESAHPRSWMMVPIFLGDTVHGALICCSNSHLYETAELEFLEEIGRRVSLALEHAESFARERRLIQTLQRATLPSRLATVKGASLSAIYRPAASEVQVGGDWYDAFELDHGRVLLTVGDVTGHGLEASIVMGKLRHAINVVAMYEPDPVRILDAAERVLHRRYPGSVATAFVALFDARNCTVTYANAGHPYPILRRSDGSIEELEAGGLPIGLRSSGSSAKAIVKSLDDAALLAFYTDGLTEVTHDMLAGERRLREAVCTDAVFFVENPAEFVEKSCVVEDPRDDVAILVLNFVQSFRRTFDSRDWRTARSTRHEFLARLNELAEPDSDLESAELIFGELAANVAQHVGGRIEIALERRNGEAVLHVIDRGQGVPITRNPTDLLTESGRGLWLIQRLGARVDVEALPGYGTHVRAVLPIRLRNPAP